MKHQKPTAIADSAAVFAQGYFKPTPAPRYYAHNLIDPIILRLAANPRIQLNYCKKGGPEDNEIEYTILAPKSKGPTTVNDPYAKTARTECMKLTIDLNGNLALTSYIPSREGRNPYGEIKADPKIQDSRDFKRLLNTLIHEVSRYYTSSFLKDNSSRYETIRHMVFQDNPLRKKSKRHNFI